MLSGRRICICLVTETPCRSSAAAQDDSLGGLAQTPGFRGPRQPAQRAEDRSPRRQPWVREHPLTPAPLPAARGEGRRGSSASRRRGEGSFPRARALGYDPAPLTGLAPAPRCRGLQLSVPLYSQALRQAWRSHLSDTCMLACRPRRTPFPWSLHDCSWDGRKNGPNGDNQV